MAVVGKNFAVLERGRIRTSGFVTWLVWVFIHVMFLPQLQNRLRVQGNGSGPIGPDNAARD